MCLKSDLKLMQKIKANRSCPKRRNSRLEAFYSLDAKCIELIHRGMVWLSISHMLLIHSQRSGHPIKGIVQI